MGITRESKLSDLMLKFIENGEGNNFSKHNIMDTATCFRADELGTLLDQCGVVLNHLTYWRPRRNGIIERRHRSIKYMAARLKLSHVESSYLYNVGHKVWFYLVNL